jgi:hypothetical protein
MSELGWICLVWGSNMSGQQKFRAVKNRSRNKTMRLLLDELTINKLDNIELREIMGITRSNINSSIQI